MTSAAAMEASTAATAVSMASFLAQRSSRRWSALLYELQRCAAADEEAMPSW
jgi:hypothetical protein